MEHVPGFIIRNMKAFYRPIELARLTAVSTDTLRHYERLGLIARAKRSVNGYREYSAGTVDRVRLIQAALSIGFTLAELSRILRVRDNGGVPCREVRELAASKSAELRERIREMKQMQKRLDGLLSEWDDRLQKTGPHTRAGLLESLQDVPGSGKKIIRRKP